MSVLRGFPRRLIATWRAVTGLDDAGADAALRAEMESHLAMHIDENVRRGMTAEDARHEALVAAGGMTLAVEAVRERRVFAWVDGLANDARYAARSLRAKPGFALGVILTLGMSIGATAGMFTIVRAVVLRPLPYLDPDRIVSITTSENGRDQEVVDDRDYFAWTRNATPAALAAYANTRAIVRLRTGFDELAGMRATAAFFEVLGVQPLLGRTFTHAEDQPGQADVVVLSEVLWRREFGGDSGVIGRPITVAERPATIIGVLPASFVLPSHPEYWEPLRLQPAEPGVTYYYQVVGRLRAGASIEALEAQLATITDRVNEQRPAGERHLTPVVKSLHERRYGDRRKPLLLLFGAVLVLLLIACANLANLALVRAASRHHEFGVRLALGASRWRLTQSLLCESLILSALGAAAGLALSAVSVAYFVRLSPAAVGHAEDIRIDWMVLGFTIALAVATGMMFGLIPAIGTGRRNLHRALTGGSRGTRSTAGQQRVRQALVIVQLAVAVVLLTAAGLVARTFYHVLSAGTGFEPEGLLSVAVQLPDARYSNATARPFFDELLTRSKHIPGVLTATFVDTPPFAGVRRTVSLKDSTHDIPRIDVIAVGGDYFRTLGARIIDGRAIDATDIRGAPRVVVVNATLARLLFARTAAVGQRVPVHGDAAVVGVSNDVAQRELEGSAPPIAYVPLAQDAPTTYMHLMVRTSGEAEPVENGIVQVARSIDSLLPPPVFTRMEQSVAQAVAPRKFTSVLLGTFAALAAALAVVGLYSVMSHLVADRTREIGIRAALGADRTRIVRHIIARGAVLVVPGIAVGLFGSAVLTRLVTSLLSGVSARDPLTFSSVAILLGSAAMVATLVPARRAARVDPIIALRAE
jgi:predicted permease